MAITSFKVRMCQALKKKINLAVERSSQRVTEWSSSPNYSAVCRITLRFAEVPLISFNLMLNLELGSVPFDMAITNIDMPPRKRAQGIVLNGGGSKRPKMGRAEPPKGGKGKGKRRATEALEYNFDSEGSQTAFFEPDDDP
uniref:Uncharacterized protein n=1 Tax=Solanum tuberosum TaxID=4113 RepID=M1D8H9_SOLTU